MKKFEGKNIREVWDFRLSKATPVIDRRTGTWVVHIYSKVNPDYDPKKPETLAKPLESHDTKIPAVTGDEHDVEKVKKCYKWLYSVRDKYSLPEIEKMKPEVAKINAANAKLAEMNRVNAEVKEGGK
jgi:cytochrome oxidase Cu insertion factor (SCO1/SenC/PrrC family)